MPRARTALSRTRIRSASRTVETLWAMTNTVLCCSRMSLSRVSWMAASVSASTAEVLSSRMKQSRVDEECPGYGDALPLPAGEPDAPLPDHGFVAVGESPR